MAIIDWQQGGGKLSWRIINSSLCLLAIIFVPLFYVRFLYNQVPDANAWRQALPLFAMGDTAFQNYYWPYFLTSAMMILLALCYGVWRKALSHKQFWGLIHVVTITGIVYGCWHFWYKDDNFHREIRMNACIEQHDWEGVIDIIKDADEPTRQMVLSKHLAFFKLGRAGNEMYAFHDGDKLPECPFIFPMVETAGKAFYLHYGLPNFCHRWCVEEGVEMGFRLDNLKYLLRCAVLTGEKEVARKYIDLLQQTHYYGDWARHYETLLTDSAALKTDSELGPILHLIPTSSILASDQSHLETFLITILSKRQTTDPVCADLTLMFALQSKDIPTFWRAFNQYASLHPDEPMPRHYQEAAFMYGNLERNVDISQMPFDNDIIQRYQEFMALAQQYAPLGQEQMRAACYPRFGTTFFFNYFMLRDLKTY